MTYVIVAVLSMNLGAFVGGLAVYRMMKWIHGPSDCDSRK